MPTKRWTITPLVAGWTSYDGGTIFGLVPKSVWNRFLPSDASNLVRIPNRCLLARNGVDVVLIDSGYGGKYPPLDRVTYGMDDGDPTFDALKKIGVAPSDITAFLATHLHFDHVGGATTLDEKRRPVPAFPNAKYYASRIEWEDAVDPIPELRVAYPQDNLRPLLDKGLALSFEDGDELFPGLVARISPGHTRGHAVFKLTTDDGTAFFFGDLAPSSWHAKQLWTTAYDVCALDTRKSKARFFGDALDKNAVVYWAHDPNTIASRVVGRSGNNFTVKPVLIDEIGDVRKR